MKKIILCGIALVAGLMSCTEDYKDWANPQNNAGGEASPKLEMMVEPTAGVIDFATETSDMIQLFTTNLQEGQVDSYSLQITGDGVDKIVEATCDAEGKMTADKLKSVVKDLFGAAPVQRTLFIKVSAEVKVISEEGVVVVKRSANPFEMKVTLDAPYIDENGYYVVGNIDGWTYTRVDAYHMKNNGGDVYDNPEFTVDIDAVDGIDTYEIKMIPAADFKDDGSVDSWARTLTALPGVTTKDYEGTFSNTNAGDNIKFDATEDAESYTITINAMTCTYTIEANMGGDKSIFDTDPILYLTGNNYGWGSTWVPLVPIHSNPTKSWRIIYLHKGEEFKFAPQAGWGDDFGMSATIEDKAGLEPSGDNNIIVGNAGWYLILVDNTEGARKVTFLKPELYLIGNTAEAGWEVAPSGLFTIPDTDKGKFVSPAFVKDDEVRMCVKFEGIDWWQTEFVVTKDGALDYRGAGGDQARVTVTAGQKCYLNFTNGSGSYK